MKCCDSFNQRLHDSINKLGKTTANYPVRDNIRKLKNDQEFQECCPCISFPLKYFIIDRLPFIAWVKKYTLAKGIKDAIAGISVGLMVIPQGLAYAELAG